jgi:hypothetical protein
MDEIYFSENNIAMQTKKLILNLELPEDQINKDLVLKCKKIITNHMKETYHKYGNLKPQNVSSKEYLEKLNRKSISDCFRLISNKKNITDEPPLKPSLKQSSQQLKPSQQLKQTQQAQQAQQFKQQAQQFKQQAQQNKLKQEPKQNYGLNQKNVDNYMRPNELMNKIKHPTQKSNPSKELASFQDAGGYASFSPIDNASGPFITATGEYGMPLEIQDDKNNSNYEQFGKKNFQDDLDRRVSMLQGNYGGPVNMNSMNQMGSQQMGSQQNFGLPQQGQQNGQGGQIDPRVAKWLNLDQSGQSMGSRGGGALAQMNAGASTGNFSNNNLSGQNQAPNSQQLQVQLNQLMMQMQKLQQSGQVNPQMTQQMMGQMQNLQKQIEATNQQPSNQYSAKQGEMGYNQQMNPNVDYSFTSCNENMGNDFNSAFDQNNMYNGHDSIDQSFKPPEKNMGTGGDDDISRKLEMMQNERNNINNQSQQSKEKFDPMKSPFQMNQQQNPNNNYNDNFFFLNNQNKQQLQQPQQSQQQYQQQPQQPQQQYQQQPQQPQQYNKQIDLQQKMDSINNNSTKPIKLKKSNKNTKSKKEIEHKTNKKSKNNKLLKKYKNISDIDDEIKKLKLELKKKDDNSSNESDKSDDIKLLKSFVSKNPLVEIDKNEDNQNEEIKEKVDEKTKALFKLLIDAKTKKTDPESPMNLTIKEKEQKIFIDDENIKYSGKEINNVLKKNIEKLNLNIISNEITERDCYNDYMIKLDKMITINDLNIIDLEIPKREDDNITELNNKLEIEINNEIKTIILESNYYNRNELVYFINEGLKSNEIDISCLIDDNDKFIFRSNTNSKFLMRSGEYSILPYLGFLKNTYLNKDKYESENSIDIGDNIFYIVIENISDEPIFLINEDEKIIEKLLNINNVIEVDHLIVKFYKTKKYIIKHNSEYSFFFENDHRINFQIN